MASGTIQAIGAIVEVSASENKSCTDSATTNVLTLNIPSAGVWMLVGAIQLNGISVANGHIQLGIAESASVTWSGDTMRTCFDTNTSSYPRRLQLSTFYKATAAITLYLNIYQSTGGARTCTYREFKAVRIA